MRRAGNEKNPRQSAGARMNWVVGLLSQLRGFAASRLRVSPIDLI